LVFLKNVGSLRDHLFEIIAPEEQNIFKNNNKKKTGSRGAERFSVVLCVSSVPEDNETQWLNISDSLNHRVRRENTEGHRVSDTKQKGPSRSRKPLILPV
jgi:hypothetical protein